MSKYFYQIGRNFQQVAAYGDAVCDMVPCVLTKAMREAQPPRQLEFDA